MVTGIEALRGGLPASLTVSVNCTEGGESLCRAAGLKIKLKVADHYSTDQ